MSRKPEAKRDRHHIVPRSRRGGSRRNIVVLPAEWHACWHALFANMTVAEVHEFVDLVMVPDVEWTARQLRSLQLRIVNRQEET